MMNYFSGGYTNFSEIKYGTFGLLIPLMILDLVLRGMALWKSSRKNQNFWFIALLVVNSMGILPFIYLMLNRDIKVASKKVSKSK